MKVKPNDILVTSVIEIPLSKVQREFQEHLDIEGNEKILFSGKYGTGKSYFLEKYFETTEAKEKYNPITLSPVNYVVSANEDIFEIIKVDIIRQLFDKKKLKLSADVPFLTTLVIKEAVKKVTKSAVKKPIQSIGIFAANLAKIGLFGIDGKAVGEGGIKLIECYAKFEADLNTKYKSNENVLDEYVEEKYQAIGTYLENNLITKSIVDSLASLKEDTEKENVLIIEDFDRLDPAHIFRVLNIFSAHHNDKGNKFGFDKVIIVCDLENIRGLYEHLYGTKVDFNGYIDKFYSTDPFYFDNTWAIKFYLKNDLRIDLSESSVDVLTDLLATFIENNQISLRSIKRATYKRKRNNRLIFSYPYLEFLIQYHREQKGFGHPKLPSYIDGKIQELRIFRKDVEIIELIRFLISVFGSYNELEKNLKQYASDVSEKKYNKMNVNYLKLLYLPELLMTAPDKNKLAYFFNNNRELRYPDFEKNGVQLYLNLKWKNENKYIGDGSYFEEAKWRTVVEGANFNLRANREMIKQICDFVEFAQNNRWLED